ncbi:short-chain dehydrogenase [Mycolicibacterium tokaiense]|uniref:Short-chain dehydrogenase n=1 Tax=Mycolicibacterium tokaiense TaxID=39695 RepID=A0A378TBM7_9MYCO|nr:short-chain dehydrogenase [Mycolicibacterium tokaiense]
MERVKLLRYSEARGDYDDVVATLNSSDPHGGSDVRQGHSRHRRLQRIRAHVRRGAGRRRPRGLRVDARHRRPQRRTGGSHQGPRRHARGGPARPGPRRLGHRLRRERGGARGRRSRPPRRPGAQRRAHGLRAVGGVQPRSARRALRRQRRRLAARQPGCAAPPAGPGRRTAGVDVEQQRRRRYTALPGPVLRCQGGDGFAGGQLRPRTGAVGHRDLDHRPWRLHPGHQPLRPRRVPGRHRGGRSLRGGALRRLHRPGAGGVQLGGPARRRSGGGGTGRGRRGRAPRGSRPFRVHIDPAQDGADVGFAVLDRLRAEMLHRTGLSELLQVASR